MHTTAVGCHWGLLWFRLRPELEAWGRGDSPTLTVVGCHWGPVILTSARIGSLGPGRFPYSHCGWVPLRPCDPDFSQNWKPRPGEIPLLSLWLGAIEALWSWLQPELEAQARGDSPTLTAVGCHWGPVIPTLARIGSLGPGRFPYSHCGWAPLRTSDSDFGQNWKPGAGEIPLLSLWLGTDSDFGQNWKPGRGDDKCSPLQWKNLGLMFKTMGPACYFFRDFLNSFKKNSLKTQNLHIHL
jgi:hypothetical protein